MHFKVKNIQRWNIGNKRKENHDAAHRTCAIDIFRQKQRVVDANPIIRLGNSVLPSQLL